MQLPVLLGNPIFCDFLGGGGPDPMLPPFDPRMQLKNFMCNFYRYLSLLVYSLFHSIKYFAMFMAWVSLLNIRIFKRSTIFYQIMVHTLNDDLYSCFTLSSFS